MASFTITCNACKAETKWEHENFKNQTKWENTGTGYNHALNLNSPWIYARPDGKEKEIDANKMICSNCGTYIIIV